MSDTQNPVTREELAEELWQSGMIFSDDALDIADAILGRFTVLHPAPTRTEGTR